MTTKHPNILLFVPDGLQVAPTRLDHPCITPNFDRVSRRGVSLRRAYTPLPTCSPARASLMTGLLPHNHGVLQVEHGVDDDQCVLRPRPHWAQRLVQAGYHTGYFGKWHIERSFELDRFGWQVNGSNRSPAYEALHHDIVKPERDYLDDRIVRWHQGMPEYRPFLHYGVTDLPPSERETSVPTRLAGQFLEEAMPGQHPWCCCVSYGAPNESMVCSRETYQRYDAARLELPRNLKDPLSDRPGLYRRAQSIWHQVTDEQWRQALACYYARITEIDQHLGGLLDQIDQAGQLDNTVVIITSDHGKYVGAHGMDAHNFGAFEELYNIPMIACGPGIASGVASEARVGLHELCPTLLNFCGAQAIDGLDGRSFATVLSGDVASAQEFDSGYAEYFGTRFGLTQRIYWQGPWKFIFNGFDGDELYNLADDPHEMKNLAGLPEHQDRVRAMMASVWRRIRDTADRTLWRSQYYSMQFAAVGPGAADPAASAPET